MTELPEALVARQKLSKLLEKVVDVESLGIDVGAGGDFGVRVTLKKNAPKEVEDTIPDKVDGVRIVRLRSGGGSISFE